MRYRFVAPDPTQTRKRYDESAGHYDSRYAELQRIKYPILLGMLRPQAGQRILDWGCGTGLASEAIRRSGARYIGLDSSAGMISRVEERAHSPVVLADCTRLPFRSGAFHGLLGATVIQNIPNTTGAFGEVARVLRTGARAVISFPQRTSLDLGGFEENRLSLVGEGSCGEDTVLCLEKNPG
jgi:ubiquinone/menaquinone biosynthesis C-methylase UbiE